MSKFKASEPLQRHSKKMNASTGFVYYRSATTPKVKRVSSTKIGERPIYKFFINCNGEYFPLRCMLDLGSTSFVISPEAAKAFAIPVVKRLKPVQVESGSGDVIPAKRLFTVPLGLSFGNHRSFNEDDLAFEMLKTSADSAALIPAWYLEKHKARGTMTSYLHFPHCSDNCYGHDKILPE